MHVLSFVLLIPGRTSTQPAAEFRPFNLPERTMETHDGDSADVSKRVSE